MKNILTAALVLVLMATLPLYAQPQYFPLDKKSAGGAYGSLPDSPARGLVLLIPGPGQNPLAAFPDSANLALAHSKGIAIFAVAHPGRLLLTPSIQRYLLETLRQVSGVAGISPENTAIGGLGEAGALVLQFAEECQSAPAFYQYRPRAVFCIDTPVDLEAWWKACDRDIQRGASPEALARALNTQRQLAEESGGSPDTLALHSPFTMGLDEPGKEQLLMGLNLRLYYHDDLSFQIRERGRDLNDHPVVSAYAMMESLVGLGHKEVSIEILPQNQGQGFNQQAWIYWLTESFGGGEGSE